MKNITKNKVMFIFPPGWFFTEPYLSLPQLKGFADSINETLNIVDDNVLFFNTLTNYNFLENKLKKCLQDYDSIKKGFEETDLKTYQKLFLINKYQDYLTEIDYWKKKLKESCDIEEYKKIYKIINCTFKVYSYYYNIKIDQSGIKSNRYDLENIDSLMKFIDNKDENIFIEYYLQSSMFNIMEQYDYIGFSVTSSSQLVSALTLIKLCKERNLSCKFLLGGGFITRIMKDSTFLESINCILDIVDFACLFEGEIILTQMFNPQFDYKQSMNVIYKEDGTIMRNDIYTGDYIKQFIKPNFDGFSLNDYFAKELVLPIVSSKNCYSQCTFCTIPQSSAKRNYIIFNLETVYQCMVDLSRKYNTSFFTFNDEVFHFKRLYLFSKILVENMADFSWMAETRLDYILNDKQMSILSLSGCKMLQFGLESYNQRILDLMKKNIKIEDIDIILEKTLQSGISIHLFSIFGFPTESLEEAKRTKDYLTQFLKKSTEEYGNKYCTVAHGKFQLDKGSDVFNNPQKYSIIIKEKNKNSFDTTYNFEITEDENYKSSKEFINKFENEKELIVNWYYPENLVLSAQETSNSSVDFDILIAEKLLVSPITNKHNLGYYYYYLDNGFLFYSENKFNELTASEKEYIDLYTSKSLERNLNLNNELALNPNCKIHISHSKEVILDKLNNKIYQLNDSQMAFYKGFSNFGIYEFMDISKKIFNVNNIIIEKVLYELYKYGIVILK